MNNIKPLLLGIASFISVATTAQIYEELDVNNVRAGMNDTTALGGVTSLLSRIDDVRNYYITDATPCGQMTLDIEEPSIDLDFELYPNPATNAVTVALSTIDQNAHYAIYDVAGQLVSEGKILSEKHTINLTALTAGLYFLQVQNGDRIGSKKLINK